MLTDISIHFSTESHSVEDIKSTLFHLLKNWNLSKSTRIHHLFSPRSIAEFYSDPVKVSNIHKVNDLIDALKLTYQVSSLNTGLPPEELQLMRVELFNYIRENEGIAIFIGNILPDSGLSTELKLAKVTNNRILLVPCMKS